MENNLIWILPFVGVLLSIALFPLLAPHFWHQHYGKVAAAWALAFIVPYAGVYGFTALADLLLHVLRDEYLPFIILVGGLYVVAGGIRVTGTLVGRPIVNLTFLLIGTLLASLMGTTGAAMLLIRPLIRANEKRRYAVHTFVFFIFLVANIGGSLTPVGDPPLFLGFLRGVPFDWPLHNLWRPMLIAASLLLALYYAIETYLYRKEGSPTVSGPHRLGVKGSYNFIFLLGIVGAVLAGGYGLPAWARDAVILLMAGLSWTLTPRQLHRDNQYDWEPVREVAKLFAAIFVCIVPALAILRAGEAGAMAGVNHLLFSPDGTPNNLAFFWLTGGLSSFLDNAPTYLVFFEAAGGDAAALTGPLNETLLAISMGAVFMGANTYIGNAPNFMVCGVVKSRGLKMPGFFGFMGWAAVCLMPVFALLSWVYFG